LGWLETKRLFLLGYLLLWPPSLMLLLHRSEQADVVGWWSRRVFVLVAADLAVLLAGTVLLWRVWSRGGQLVARFEAALHVVRRKRILLWTIAWMPPAGLLVGVLYLARLSVPLSLALLCSLTSAFLLVCVWELALLFPGKQMAEQRNLLKKLSLLGFSLVVTLLTVEATGWIFQWHRFALWDVNPKNIDVRFRTDAFDVRVVTNRQGLREPHMIPLEPDDVHRVVVVGDSVTFGWGVEYEDTYPKVAERVLVGEYELADVQIINMGRAGAEPSDYLTFVRRYAAQLEPTIIVLGFLVGNDCPISPPARIRTDEEMKSASRKRIADSYQPRAERIIESSCVASLLYTGLYQPLGSLSSMALEGRRGAVYGEPNPLASAALESELDIAKNPERSREILEQLQREGWIAKGLQWRVSPWLLRSVMTHPNGPADSLVTRAETAEAMRQEWRLCEDVLRETKRVAEAAGAELVVLAVPHSHAVSRRWVRFLGELGCDVNEEMTSTRTINEWLAEFADREQIPCIDPLDQFRTASESGQRLYFDTDDHMTPLGQHLLGEALADGLLEAANTLKRTGP